MTSEMSGIGGAYSVGRGASGLGPFGRITLDVIGMTHQHRQAASSRWPPDTSQNPDLEQRNGHSAPRDEVVRSVVDRRRCSVLLVGDVLAPRGGVAVVVDLEHREVGHEAFRCRAVPVLRAYEARERDARRQRGPCSAAQARVPTFTPALNAAADALATPSRSRRARRACCPRPRR